MTEITESGRSSLAVSGAEAPPSAGRTALSDRLPRAWMFPLLASAAAWVLILAAWNIAGAIYGPMSWERYFSYKDSTLDFSYRSDRFSRAEFVRLFSGSGLSFAGVGSSSQ